METAAHPDFSVVIPSHNVERWVLATLASVAKQSESVEIIVVDDASTDRTVEVVRGSGIPVSLYEENHRNAAAARNSGAARARGRWLAFLDSDDLWLPEYLSLSRQILEASGDRLLVNRPRELGYPEGPISDVFELDLGPASSNLGKSHLSRALNKPSHGFHTSGLVIERRHFLDVGGFDESQRRRHDLELTLRLIAKGSWSYNLEPKWLYRAGRPGSISVSKAECDYYRLRAFLLNRSAYGDLFDSVIKRSAIRALGSASSIKDPAIRRAAINASMSEVSRFRRLAYQAVGDKTFLLFPLQVLARAFRWFARSVNPRRNIR